MTQISLTSPAAVTILLDRSKIFSVAPGISSYLTVAIPAESVAQAPTSPTDYGPYLADREVTLNLMLGTVVYEVKESAGGGAVSAASIVTALDEATPAELAEIQSSVSRARTGSTLAARLDNLQSVTIQSIGDSTTNDTGDCIYEIALQIAAKYPEYQVVHALWSDATQAYGADTVIQAGAAASVLAFSDTFATGSGELFGRTPDTAGYAWSRDGINANGDWVVGGGVITRSADATMGMVIAPFGLLGDHEFTLDISQFSTVGDASGARSFGVHVKYVDYNNQLEVRITTSTAGVVSLQIIKRIAGAATTLATAAAPAGFANNTVGQSGVLNIKQSGTAITVKMGAATVLTATLAAGDLTALANATKCGFYATVGASGAWIGMQISSASTTVTPTATSIPTVRFWNGGMPGATLAYHSDPTRFPLLVKPADVVLVTCSHNYTTMLGADYAPILKEFVNKLIASQPDIDVIVASTNPVKDPISWDLQSASRDAHMRVMADQAGYGFVAIRQGFLTTPSWQTLISSDGLHPTSSGAGSGGKKWRDIFWTWLCGKQYMPRA
jgi:hypothetical protein